ncbi:MAG: 1-phosphofructokinase family hexose kinase [Acidobacteria bacterium]|nr:1-phosphofructokinase family hexose kinase [Acidobacteriota bacterium]
MLDTDKYILIVSLNTGIDRIIYLSNFELGKISRATRVVEQAGGKAVNVARALVALGKRVLVIGFVGSFTGQHIRQNLLDSKIPARLIPISGSSRSCYILIDENKKQDTVINEPGPEITSIEFNQFYQELITYLPKASMLICSGSLPRGVSNNSYQQFVNLAHSYKIPALVDASGETLKLALQAKPYLIKPNRDEAENLLNKSISDKEALIAAREIHQSGVAIGLISLGDKGVAATWSNGELFLAAPKLDAINCVGCGDAFLAGCASAIIENKHPQEIISWGVAAGSANALVGGANINLSEVERLKNGLIY